MRLTSQQFDTGSAGTTPPSLPTGASGVLGWLRSIYDRVFHGFDKSTVNSTVTPLAAGGIFPGAWELITDYEQLTVVLYGEPSTFQGVGASAPGTVLVQFSSDGGTTTDVFLPILVDDPGYFIPYPLIPVGTHVKIGYRNDGGALAGGTSAPATQTAFRLTTQRHKAATKELTRTLAQDIRDNQPVNLTRAVTMGKDPSGTYVNQKAGGLLVVSPAATALGISGVFTSSVVDTIGFPSIALSLTADQVSAVNGVDIQFSDTPAFTAVRGHVRFSYLAQDISNGGDFDPFPPRDRYMRLVYTNGLTGNAAAPYFLWRMSPFSFQTSDPLQVSFSKGAYGGQNGISGTVNVPAGAVVRSFACFSGNVTASVTIPGTSGTLALPGSNQQSTTYEDAPDPGTMVGPVTFVFSQTAGFAVAWVL